jgi:hypothetical protein
LEYTGSKNSAQDILNWVNRKTNPASIVVNSVDLMRKMVMENQVMMVFLGQHKNQKEYINFSEYAL